MIVMDSWLVEDHAVTLLDAHISRFIVGCEQVFQVRPPNSLLDAARSTPQRPGRWFPRVWFDGRNGRLEWRSAPARRTNTRLWIPLLEDPRNYPAIKGPDAFALAQLREEAQYRGCDDAVLHRGDELVEAANGTIVVQCEGRLWVPPGPRLDSVTLRRVRQNFDIQERHISLRELRQNQAWWLSSLHGVTPISTVLG